MSDRACEPDRKQQYISRWKFWMEARMGIGGLALIDLLTQDKLLDAECLANLAGGLDSPLAPNFGNKSLDSHKD